MVRIRDLQSLDTGSTPVRAILKLLSSNRLGYDTLNVMMWVRVPSGVLLKIFLYFSDFFLESEKDFCYNAEI